MIMFEISEVVVEAVQMPEIRNLAFDDRTLQAFASESRACKVRSQNSRFRGSAIRTTVPPFHHFQMCSQLA